MRLVEEQTAAIDSLQAREMAVVTQLRQAEEAQWEGRRREFQVPYALTLPSPKVRLGVRVGVGLGVG